MKTILVSMVSTAAMVGTYAEHVQALKWRDPNRPVMSMWGPWALGGSLGAGTVNANNTLNRINASDGYATDGPERLWAEDSGGYKGAEESAIRLHDQPWGPRQTQYLFHG